MNLKLFTGSIFGILQIIICSLNIPSFCSFEIYCCVREISFLAKIQIEDTVLEIVFFSPTDDFCVQKYFIWIPVDRWARKKLRKWAPSCTYFMGYLPSFSMYRPCSPSSVNVLCIFIVNRQAAGALGFIRTNIYLI